MVLPGNVHLKRHMLACGPGSNNEIVKSRQENHFECENDRQSSRVVSGEEDRTRAGSPLSVLGDIFSVTVLRVQDIFAGTLAMYHASRMKSDDCDDRRCGYLCIP